ncbi:hypothetical protein AXK12_02060 [Cephaloticoccus capnophilus]|uniref:Dienelactone hydrolase domain-containing protein n=1 Tax=Cephaloticoccus capnophilus TaxID=1548208 RepID=A0A139SS27_9BACT|nr:hypothetical protein AXK12_02060 [Cephaloticoccus capnophilus]
MLSAFVSSASLMAAIVEKPISYEHSGATLHGLLVYDEAKVGGGERLPGVLVIHQWMGRGEFEAAQARQLAAEGYVAFALDMYGEQPKNTAEARALTAQFYGKALMAERAGAGLDQLLSSDFVDSEKVAAIGYCFGGTTAMALAYSAAPLAGIVSFHGGLIEAPETAPEPLRAKFLICHGAVDPFVPWAQVQATLDSLEAAKIDYQFIAYQGAVHSFTDPAATGEGSPGAKYQREAAERSWAHMIQFFEEIF